MVALFAITPIIGTILGAFGLMGLLGIPLDNATVMISALAIGIGVDYAIHILSRYKRERRSGECMETAIRDTIHSTGKAVVINALAVGMGFLVLVFSSIVPLRNFGALITLTMLLSSGGALVVIPALLRLGGHSRLDLSASEEELVGVESDELPGGDSSLGGEE